MTDCFEEVVDVDREQGWTEHRALWYTACDLHFSGCVRTKNHPLSSSGEKVADPPEQTPTDAVSLKLDQKARMRNGVEGLREVEEYHVDRSLLGELVGDEVNCLEEVGRARLVRHEAVLTVAEQMMMVEVRHNGFAHKPLEYLAHDGQKRDRTIVAWVLAVSLLED